MPNRLSVLLVEDEVKLLKAVHQGLVENNFRVDTAADGKVAYSLAMKNAYSVIVSDIIMPRMTGLELLKQLRSEGIRTPMILLTALSQMDDKVEGFEAGADDYLTKPFDFQELLLRIKAVARRPINSYLKDNVLQFHDLEMNLNSKEVTRQGKKIVLTPREFDLMEYFLRNPGRVISKSEIAESVWKLDFETGTNLVEVYVNFLRKKIENGFDKKLIYTQFKTGYILNNPEKA